MAGKGVAVYIIALVWMAAALFGFLIGGMADVAVAIGVAMIPIAVMGLAVALDNRPMGG